MKLFNNSCAEEYPTLQIAFITFASLVRSIRPTSRVLTNTFRISIILCTRFFIKSKHRINSSFSMAEKKKTAQLKEKFSPDGWVATTLIDNKMIYTIGLLLIMQVFSLHLLKDTEKWCKESVNVPWVVGACCF